MSALTNLGQQSPIQTTTKGLATLDTTGFQAISGDAMKPASSIGGSSGMGFGGLASAGVSALSAIPGIVATAQIDPSDAESSDEVRNLIKAKRAGFVSQGMQVGGAVGSAFGPIGGLIGSAVGGIGGYIVGDLGKEKEFEQFHERENKESNEEFYASQQERLQNYMNTTTSERMKAEMDLMKQAQGLYL